MAKITRIEAERDEAKRAAAEAKRVATAARKEIRELREHAELVAADAEADKEYSARAGHVGQEQLKLQVKQMASDQKRHRDYVRFTVVRVRHLIDPSLGSAAACDVPGQF